MTDINAGGSITGAGQTVSIGLEGYSCCGIEISGAAWSATLVVEATINGATFYTPFVQSPTGGAGTSSFTPNQAVNGRTIAVCPGAARLQVRCSAFTSGSASVILRPTNAAGGAGGGGTGPTALVGGAAATKTSVAAVAADTLLIAFNAARLGATVVNEGTAGILYVSLGSTAASITSYTKRMVSSEYYEVPFGFTGPVRGIWTGPDGFARCTEVIA